MIHVDQEVIENAVRKTLRFVLAEQREQIAKAIEAESLLEEYQDGYPGAMKRVGMAIAAEIARGIQE